METIFDLERWNFESNYNCYLILEKKIFKKYANFRSFFWHTKHRFDYDLD